MSQKLIIKEVIVVEGRDDTAAVLRAVDAATIETHGFGITRATWKRLEEAYRMRGLIVLTDPDHAGEEIRKKISLRFPDAGQAFIARSKATEGSDTGVENASPQDIREALSKVSFSLTEKRAEFTEADLAAAGLSGEDGARERREALGEALGIGYANAKTLLGRLNGLGVSREAFDRETESLRKKV